MRKWSGQNIGLYDWALVALALAVLSVYAFYVLNHLFRSPYLGFEFLTNSATNGWLVIDSTQEGLEVGTLITQIGDLSFEEYNTNLLRVLFSGYGPTNKVLLIIPPGDTEFYLELSLPSNADYFRRWVGTLWFFPFWAAGTIVLLFLRPRDNRWRLLVAFFYLIALWFSLGEIAIWRVMGARLLYGVLLWLLVPVTIHLHLVVPDILFQKALRFILPPLYGISLLLASLELLQLVPSSLPLNGFVLALLLSLLLLLYRLFLPATLPPERISTRLMLAGIGLAFLPGIIVATIPQLLSFPIASNMALAVAYLAIPLLPIFYSYAIYKRQLGALEFRANRFLSQYSFILIFPLFLLMAILFGLQAIDTPNVLTLYLLFVSIIFVVVTPPIFQFYQRSVNKLAYGTVHDPNMIIRVFANEIPSAFSRTQLIDLLKKQILPTLLVRQSALYLFQGDEETIFYEDGLNIIEQRPLPMQVENLMQHTGEYRPPNEIDIDDTNWIRLVLPLKSRATAMGAWYFGRRDPDDFYPQNDIELLQALANQIAPVIENILLYEAVKRQADNLANQVAERTVELKDARDQTQAILDSAGEGVFFADPQGHLRYANAALINMTGFVTKELLGQPLTILGGDTAVVGNESPMWKAINQGQGWHGEIIEHRKDGTPYDVKLTVSPLHVENGDVRGFVGVQSDISKLKEVDRLKTNIIANVSHELKTPLANITLYLQLLEQGKQENRVRYLSVLNRETERLTRLIHDLLDVSMLEAGNPAKFNPINLNRLVEEVVNANRVRAEANNIVLHVSMPSLLPLVLADRDQVEQVIINLLMNAFAYSLPGSQVKVTGGTGVLEAQPAVWVCVSDTGLGIAKEEKAHLFDRFYRGDASHKSQAAGTGLGLTICKEIMDRHQGRIDVESELDRGTAVTIWFPTIPNNI